MNGAFRYGKQDRPFLGGALFFRSSTVFRIPEDGVYRFDVVGTGGAGGACIAGDANVTTLAAGGGGGGYCNATRELSKGTLIDISIGAAGSGVQTYVGSSQTAWAGANGGTVRVTGGGLGLVATGGLGGAATWNVLTTVAGGKAGVGIGGDFNAVGGDGGSVSAASNASWLALAGSGGTSGHPYGDGRAGTSYLGSSTNQLLAAGGPGVGSSNSGFFLDLNYQSWAGPQHVTGSSDSKSPLVFGASLPLLSLNGLISTVASRPGGPGAGCSTGNGYLAGLFGGGGAMAGVPVNGFNYGASYGWIGGGGGALSYNSQATTMNPNGYYTNGSGGSGLVVIERLY